MRGGGEGDPGHIWSFENKLSNSYLLLNLPNDWIPRTAMNIPIGLPNAKKASGFMSSFGYRTNGCPVPKYNMFDSLMM